MPGLAKLSLGNKQRRIALTLLCAWVLLGISFAAHAQPADLAATPDADSNDPYIVQKAQELNHDPALIFAFVRDEIGFDSYQGSLRGARGTLWSKSGNALDRASLMIALLRASNIPARYVSGTLSNSQAGELIGDMFARPLRVFGCLDPSEPTADPASDPQLLAETKQHYWVQLGAGNTDADPSFPDAELGDTFASAQGTFTEVADALRHKVTVDLKRELTAPGAVLLTGGAASGEVATVLEQTLNAVDLVGRSISIGHLVSSSDLGVIFPTIIHTYSPYLVINQRDGQVHQAPVLDGSPYQEVLTGFPFGSQVLTGVFLDVTLRFPDGRTETVEKTLLDRIGFAARNNGAAASLNVTADPLPAMISQDIVTLEVTASAMPEEVIEAQRAVLDQLIARIAALPSDLDMFTAPAGDVQQALLIFENLGLEATSFFAGNLLFGSDQWADILMSVLHTSWYFDSPRIVAVRHDWRKKTDEETHLTLELDILRNEPRSHPAPGQARFAAQVLRFLRGLGDSLIEQETLGSQTASSGVLGSASIFLQAMDQPGTHVEAIDAGRLSHLSTLGLPNEATARIASAVQSGKVALVPSQSVTIDGAERLAWLEMDRLSGDIIAVSDDGTHGMLEKLSVRQVGPRQIHQVGFKKGPDPGEIERIVREAQEANRLGSTADHLAKLKRQIREIIPLAGAIVSGGVDLNKLISDLTLKAKYVGGVDPPVGDLLFGTRTTSPEFAGLGGGGGIALATVLDPIFSVPVGQTDLPTVFKVGFRNQTSVTDTFTIDLSNVPAGFTADTSVPSLVLAPGEIGEISVCLRPTGGVPPAGTPASFDVTVTSLSNPAITASDGESFLVPDVHEVTMVVDPAVASSSPGIPVDATLTLTAIGNAPATISLEVDQPSGVDVSGAPANVNLAAGQTISFPLSVTVGGSVTLNQDLNVLFTGEVTGALDPDPITAGLRLSHRSSEGAAIEDAARTAEEKQNPSLATALTAVADSLGELQSNPGNGALCEQLRLRLDNLDRVVDADPALGIFASRVDGVRNLAATCDVPGIAALLPSLAADLAQAAGPSVLQGVAIGISPNTPVTQPGVAVGANILVTNRGADSVDVALALDGLPGGVQTTGPGSPFTLGAGATRSVAITLTPTLEGRFPFRAVAQIDGGASSAAASAVLSAVSAAVNVMSVAGDPSFILVNGTTRIKATIANTVNLPITANAVLTIKRSDGTVQYESPSPTLIQIPVSGSTTTFDLDQVTATSWPQDFYAIELLLLSQSGGPIPGGEGTGTLPVGTPVKTSVSADPILVPPGSSTVSTTIEVEPRFTLGVGGGVGLEPTDPSMDRINWAAASRGATITVSQPGPINPSPSILIDELGSGSEHYVGADWHGGFHLLDLGAIRTIDTIQLHLWDGDERYARYRIETSLDGSMFDPLVDRDSGEQRGVQRHTFAPTSMRYIKIIPTFESFDGTAAYLTNEILAIGDDTATPVATQSLTLDGVADAAPSDFTAGQKLTLNAGIYEVKHVGGAISFSPNDSDTNGKTWTFKVNVHVPVVSKSYQLGHLHDAISTYATELEAEADYLGESFKLYLPVHADVYFWIPDASPNDNRGDETIEIRQLSGPNDQLPVRVLDAMMRSVLWEEAEVANWRGFGANHWIALPNYDCFGCHVHAEGSAGLEVSRQKLPELPIDRPLMNKFVDAYLGWQNPEGSYSPFNAAWTTQTSLAAWAMSYFRDADFDRLLSRFMKALDFLVTRQDPGGAWVADHADNLSAPLYFDGFPSATHTAGNIQAFAKILSFDQVDDFVPFPAMDATIAGGSITMPQNFGATLELAFAPVENVTGVRISISDTFSGNGNFVVSELELFDGVSPKTIATASANFEQSNYPIVESFNGVTNDTSDGWAYFPQDSRVTPARGLWVLSSPTTLDGIRITQTFPTHQSKTLAIEITTDPNPALGGNFSEVTGLELGLTTAERMPRYRLALEKAAGALSGASWPFDRNTRTAAQTIIGLNAALPFLSGGAATAAQARILQADSFLRGSQLDDGGWKDAPADVDISRALPTAQALEALLLAAQSSVDPAILAGAEYLLINQKPEGAWPAPPGLQRRLASTTWVEIALPTIFENLSSLTVDVDHLVPTGTGVTPVDDSFSPPLDSRQSGAGHETLRWTALVNTTNRQDFSFASQLQDMKPGEVRQISDGTSIQFTSVAGEGSVELAPLLVSARHILSLDPPKRTVQAGNTAEYTVTLENLLGASETFELSVSGVPPSSVTFPTTATLSAGEIRTLSLRIDTPVDSLPGEYGFTVAAQSASGVADFVGGELQITAGPGGGGPVTFETMAVHVALVPAQATAGQGTSAFFTVRVTNVGNETDTYTLSRALPAGFVGVLETTTVTVAPGLDNFRDVGLTVTPAPGTAVGAHGFSVRATSTTDEGIEDDAAGTIDVVGEGVDVEITPSSGSPASSFQLQVRNTGQSEDTFDLTLGGPVGVVSTLGTSSVTLAPGTSVNVPITLGAVSFAQAGGLELLGTATSRANPAVRDSARATVTIASSKSMTAEFDPHTITLTSPGQAMFLLVVQNTGSQADFYKAELVSTTGPLTAALNGFDGQPTPLIDTLELPGLATGVLVLNADLSAVGRGEATVRITSLSDGAISDASVAALQTPPISMNQPPEVDAGADRTAGIGQSVSVNATFTDPDEGDVHTATVSWGDSTPTVDATVNQATKTVSASHSYALTGTYTVTVCVTDDQEAQDCDSFEVEVEERASCGECGGPTVVVDGMIEIDASNLMQTAGVLAPFVSFDGQTITVDLGDRGLHVTSNGRISVLADKGRQPANFHDRGNHGTPHLVIRSTCTLQVDEATRGKVRTIYRNTRGVIETTARGGRAGDIRLEFDGAVSVHGGVQSFQERLPDKVDGLSGKITLSSGCGNVEIGPKAWVVGWGAIGSGAITLEARERGDVSVRGLVLNRTNKDRGANAPPEIHVRANGGAVTIDGSNLVLDEWAHMGTRYDVTSGLVTLSRTAADVGRIAIQAKGDVAISRDVPAHRINRESFAAVTTAVNASGAIGGEIRIRSLEGRIVVEDRAVQASGRADNSAALIELTADKDVVVAAPAAATAQHQPTLSTASHPSNRKSRGGRNELTSCDGQVRIETGAQVLATGKAAGTNALTGDGVTVLGTVNPAPLAGTSCADPEPLF